jgi:hypothetical protein
LQWYMVTICLSVPGNRFSCTVLPLPTIDYDAHCYFVLSRGPAILTKSVIFLTKPA